MVVESKAMDHIRKVLEKIGGVNTSLKAVI